FYPKEVIVRMSDFKTNEYANLIGGKQFEPEEENPMLGFRGASRYYHDLYREGFLLECKAIKKVREDMGLENVKLMIPFCRTVEEGEKVVNLMAENGLKRGENGTEIYVMVEIPSNVILLEEFAKVFDGFSIGSNDLTQLTLGIDRDSQLISSLFDENNPAPKQMIALAIEKANKAGKKIGLCGQAPSDFPEFASFLVKAGIDSISFNPDALLKGIRNIKKAEEEPEKEEPVM
ncbi:MAG: putative PEP-binding protein, partial [Salinimicrobium sediminis]|nr:putative PEP-binding protein [Salinimicrobium sediminis]